MQALPRRRPRRSSTILLSPQVHLDNRTDSIDRPLAGIAIMLTGIASFAIMDALIKWLTADYPVPQVIALRS